MFQDNYSKIIILVKILFYTISVTHTHTRKHDYVKHEL